LGEDRDAKQRRDSKDCSQLTSCFDEINQVLVGCETAAGLPLALQQVLEITGMAIRASRMFLLENTNGAQNSLPRLVTSARWLHPDVKQLNDNPPPSELSHSNLPPRWVERFSAGQPVHGPAGAFPEHEQQVLACWHTTSIAAVPLKAGPRWWGVLIAGDVDESREWTPAEITLLRQVGALLVLRLEGWQWKPEVVDERRRQQTLFDFMPQAYHALDPTGHILEVNEAWLNQLGYAREEVKGRWFGELLPPEQQDEFRLALAGLSCSNEPLRAHWRLRRVDGSYVDISCTCKNQRSSSNEVELIHCMLADITELAIAHETLAHSELVKSLVLDSIDEFVVYEDLEQRVAWANQATETFTGKPLTEITGMHCFEVLFSRAEPCPGCPIPAVIKTKQPQRGEVSSPDGRWWEVFGTPVFDQNNSEREITGIVKVARDITRRKQALKQLKDDEARFRAVVEDQTEFICRFTPDGKLTFANAAICRLYRMDPANAVGQPLDAFLTPDELRRFMIRVERITPRHPIQSFRVHSITPRGRNYWGDWTIRAIYDADSFLVEYQAVGRDVTAEQRARQQLADSRASLAEAQEIAHVGSWRWDIQTNEVHWSDEIWRIFGLEPRVGPHQRGQFREFVHPEDLPLMRDAINEALAGRRPYNFHYRITRADGELRHIHTRGIVRRDPAGQPVRFHGVLHDITELQSAQDALAQSESRIRAIIQAVPDLMFRLDRDGRYLEYFAAAEELLAAPPNILLGRTMHELLPAAVAQQGYAALMHTLATGEIAAFEYELELPAGRYWFEARMSRCGKNEALAIVRDITPRVQAAQALRASDQRYRNIVETATEGVLSINERFEVTYVNDQMARMLGYTAPEMLGLDVTCFMLPEDLDDHTWQMEHRKRGESTTYARQLLRKDGQVVHAMVSARALLNEDGIFCGSFAMFSDITSLKLAEQALRDSEIRYRLLFDQLLDPVYVHYNLTTQDRDSYFLEVNRAACELLGYTLDEFKQLSPADFDAGGPDVDLSRWHDQLFSGQPVVFERLHRSKSGELIPVEIHSRALNVHDELVILSVVRDLRARHEAEAELKRSESRFRFMFENHVLAMLLIEPDTGQIINANSAAQSFYGYSLAEFQRMDIHDINMLSPDQIELARQQVKHAECARFVFPHKLASGEVRTVEVYSTAIVVENQPLLFSIIHDITEREQALESLQASEARFRSLLQIAPVAIGLVADRVIQWNNELMQQMLGYQPTELEGQSARILYPSQAEFERVGRDYACQIDRQGYGTVETTWIRRDGQQLNIQLSSALLDPQDESQGVIFTALDITQRKLAEEERDSLIEDLSKSLAEIRTLSGLLPICANCKKIRNDSGYWQQIEGYIQQHSTAQFSHSICPECVQKFYPDFNDDPDALREAADLPH
jgi:PAS domain S-box-containing protein